MHTAARAVGLARAALEDSILYLQEREQFGQPIGDFQALRFTSPTWPRRSSSRAAASTGRSPTCSTSALRANKEASMVKLVATEMAVRVTNQAHAAARRQRLHHRAQVERLLARRPADHDLRGPSEIQKRIIATACSRVTA